MKRKTIIATGITAAVVVALGSGYAYSAINNRPVVGVAEVARTPLSVTVSASGSLVAARSAGVYPPAAGTVAKVLVTDGDPVAAGDTLAVMAKGPLTLALAQARAANSAARAQLDAVNSGVPTAIERTAANAALSSARSQVSTAAKNYSALLSDYRDADAAGKDLLRPALRTAETAKAQANAALKSAQAALNRLSVASRVSLARTAAKQGVQATKQAVKLAEANLAGIELTAPFAGTVRVNGVVEKGSGLTPGVAPFTVVDPTRMEFEAAVGETDIAGVAKKQPTTVTLDAFTEPFTGTVSRVQSAAETTATGSIAFPVRVAFKAGDARLFAGMSGSADIEVETIPDALAVPVESVLTAGTARTVFVLGTDGSVHSRQVTIGAATDSQVQVLSGVVAGDRVVTTGASTLTDGQQVRTQS